MLPSIAYDCVSLLPAGGSTVKTATAMNEAASSGRTGGRAPRATAIRPAATPTAAMTAVPQRVNSTKSSGRPSDTHHGGPPEVCRITGTLIDGPATDTAIITRSETVMQAAAVQTSARVLPAARVVRSLTVFTPQMHMSGPGGDTGACPADGPTVSDRTFRTGKGVFALLRAAKC